MKEKIQIIINITIVIALAAVAYHFNEKYSKLNEANEQHELNNRALLGKYSDSMQRIDTLKNTITNLQSGVVEVAEVDRLKIKSISVEDFTLVSKNGNELITMKSSKGMSSLRIKGEQGHSGISLTVSENGRKGLILGVSHPLLKL
jgi:alanyl-tRNA synthetase